MVQDLIKQRAHGRRFMGGDFLPGGGTCCHASETQTHYKSTCWHLFAGGRLHLLPLARPLRCLSARTRLGSRQFMAVAVAAVRFRVNWHKPLPDQLSAEEAYGVIACKVDFKRLLALMAALRDDCAVVVRCALRQAGCGQRKDRRRDTNARLS